MLCRGEKLLRVILPQAVCGVLIHHGKVAHAPPYLSRFLNQEEGELRRWVKSRGGRIETVGQEGDA